MFRFFAAWASITQNIVCLPHWNLEAVILTCGFSNILVKEAGRSPPPFPFIFFKPVTCIIGHDDNVIVPKIAQDEQADYEGELVSRPPSFLEMLWRHLDDPLECRKELTCCR